MDDLISRQQTIEHLKKRLIETALNNTGVKASCDSIFADTADNRIEPWVNEVPTTQSEIIHCKDCIWHNKDINQCQRQICAVMYADDFCNYGERRGEQDG